MFRTIPLRVLLLAASLSASAVFAQPKITSLNPEWVHRGGTVEITLRGDGLNSVTGFVFSGDAGLAGIVILETNPPPAVTIESSTSGIAVAPAAPRDRGQSLRARFSASADAALGNREVRVVSADGISAPLNISVGAHPELSENEPNNAPQQATSVKLPAALTGVIQAATDVDHFKFAARKGEQLVFEVMAQRSGSPLDSSLAILDASGKELARDEDSRGFDSVVEFTSPADGEYLVQIRDFQYRGGGDYKYRIFAGALPFVDYVFPFGGQRGQSVEIALTGRNLEGAERMTLNIDSSAPLGRQEIRMNTPRGLSNPILFDVREWPNFVEKEPNDGTNANAVAAPVVINGRIGAPGDVDRFTFKAAADGKLTAEVEARRFGSPLDAFITLHAGEAQVSQNDDAPGADARLDFDVKKGSEYTITIRDLTEHGGTNFGYRLALRPPSTPVPSLAARFFPDAVRLNRNGRTHVRCEIVRQGFDSPVRVSVRNLPPGVSADSVVIPAGRNEADLLISAGSEAPIGTVPLEIIAQAMTGLRELTAIATAILPQGVAERAFKQGFLSVLDTTPFTIDALTLGTSMDQLQSGTIDVLVNRQPRFTENVRLSAVGFSAGREPITKSLSVGELTVKADARTAQLKLTANVNSELGVRTVLLRGESTNNGRLVVEFSRPVAVGVSQIPFVLSAAPSRLTLNASRAGSTNYDETTLKVNVERRGFTGEIPLTIAGVPEGVRVTGTNIAANAGEATLTLVATETARPTTNATFTIHGVATFNDRIYRHKTGGVRLSISPPRAEVAETNAAGKRPSP